MSSQRFHHRKTRIEPNVDDPLSEPTVNRRIWAAYLARGYNRSTWANALGMSYPHVDQIDTGKITPRLVTLAKMAKLLGTYSLDELVYGHDAPLRRNEVDLSDASIKSLLLDLGATAETAEALGQHVASPSGRFVTLTRSYVTAFVAGYSAARADGAEPRAAIESAKRAAANAQANAEAVAQRIRPVTRAQMQALAEPLASTTTPRKKRRA